MPTYGPPPVMFVRGQGTELWDDDGKRYLDFLCGLAVTSLGHAHPVVAEAIAEQARTLLHVSNLFANDTRGEVAVDASTSCCGGRRGQVFFCNSGAEANEARHQAGPQVGRPRPPRRGERVRQLPRPHAGHAARHRPAGQARGVPAAARGFRHVAWNDLDALERRSTPTCRRVLLEPVQGEGGVNPADRRVLPGRAGAVRRARPADHGRRGADRLRPHRRVVRLPALRRPARRRDAGQGARQRHARSARAGPSARWPPRSSRATTPRRTAARRSPPRRPGRCSPRCGASTRRRWPAARRRELTAQAARRCPASRTCAASACCWPPSCRRPRQSKPVADALLDAGLVVNAVTRHRAAPRPAAHRVDAEIDEAVGHARRRAGATWSAGVTVRHFLDIDDLTADELVAVLDLAERPIAAAACSTARARRCCSRSRRPAPGTRSRWPWCSSAATRSPMRRRGRARHARDGRGPHPDARRLPRGDRGPGVRARQGRAHGRGVDGAGRQHAVRRRHPLQALADVLTCARSSARSTAARRLGRRLQQRGPLAGRGGAAMLGMTMHVGLPRRLRPDRRPTRRPMPWRRATTDPADGGRGRRRVVHRRLVLDGPGGRGRRAPPGVSPVPGERRPAWRGPSPTPSSCTACPPTGARRSTDEVLDGPRSRIFRRGAQPHAHRPRRCCRLPAAGVRAVTATKAAAPALRDRQAASPSTRVTSQPQLVELLRRARHQRHPGHGVARPRRPRRHQGAHGRRRDGVRHPRVRARAQGARATICDASWASGWPR